MSKNGKSELYLIRVEHDPEYPRMREKEIRNWLEQSLEPEAEVKAINFRRLWGREKHRKAFLKEMETV